MGALASQNAGKFGRSLRFGILWSEIGIFIDFVEKNEILKNFKK